MPIEFRCTQCAKLLRTADDTAGKQAKCPACQAIMTVPSPQAATPPHPSEGVSPFGSGSGQSPQSPFGGDQPASGGTAGGEGNYHAPPPYYGSPFSATTGGGEIRPAPIDFGDTLSRAWAAFTDQLGMCILVAFVCFIMNVIAGQAANFAGMLFGAAAGHQALGSLMAFPLTLAAQLFAFWIGIGQAMFFLKVARGQEAPVSDIFAGGPYILRLLGASILLGIGCFLLVVLCCLPGGIMAGIGGATNNDALTGVGIVVAVVGMIAGLVLYAIVMLMLFQFYYLIIDRDMGIIEAFETSRELMRGNKLTVFLIYLVAVILGMVFVVCTCGCGLLAIIPYMGVLYATIYLLCSGQPTLTDIHNAQQYQQQYQA